MKKTLLKKRYFIFSDLSYLLFNSIRLTANLRAQINSGDPGLSFDYLTILLASIVRLG